MILEGLGSSLPFLVRTPEGVVAAALDALSRLGRLERVSSLYRSPAWPNESDPPFVNAVAAISADLAPLPLLSALGGVEAGDVFLDGGDDPLPTPRCALELPHRRLADRDFVLAPLAEIAPAWRHPVTGTPARALLSRLPAVRARAI